MFFFLMMRRPPRSTLERSSAASDVYKRQDLRSSLPDGFDFAGVVIDPVLRMHLEPLDLVYALSLIHISEPTRPY